jgi:hypothetical protein
MTLKDNTIKVALMLIYVKIVSCFRKVLCKSVVSGYCYAVANLVAALRYEPQSRLFHSQSGHWDFLLNPSGRTVVLGSTQPLTEISTRCFAGE